MDSFYHKDYQYFSRYFTQRKATSYGLTGWVRNAPSSIVSFQLKDKCHLSDYRKGWGWSARRGRWTAKISKGYWQGTESRSRGQTGKVWNRGSRRRSIVWCQILRDKFIHRMLIIRACLPNGKGVCPHNRYVSHIRHYRFISLHVAQLRVAMLNFTKFSVKIDHPS
jgi:hypothetical protein